MLNRDTCCYPCIHINNIEKDMETSVQNKLRNALMTVHLMKIQLYNFVFILCTNFGSRSIRLGHSHKHKAHKYSQLSDFPSLFLDQILSPYT